MKVIHDLEQKVPLYSWAERIDALSLKRLKNLARWDRFAGPIAVMPDVHSAGDVCVGTVLVTDTCVLPTAVGEDLGCGMCSQRFDVDARALDREDLEHIVDQIMLRVPSGRRVHAQPQALADHLKDAPLSTGALSHQKDWLARRNVGTLGGGNHFIELQRDTLNRLWVTVHSGSRGIGAAIAAHHAKIATAKSAPPAAVLPWLELGTREADVFFEDLNWALKFAAENRRQMMSRTEEILSLHIGARRGIDFFDVAHNIISIETHEGRQRVVHRKGAMPASPGMRGIIPGSMGTASYIIEGLGNAASYESCSHGAGRVLSRGEAHRRISLADLRRQMRHVVYSQNRAIEAALVEEAPAAYKNIRDVLEQQADLAKPLLRLEPLAVVKGA